MRFPQFKRNRGRVGLVITEHTLAIAARAPGSDEPASVDFLEMHSGIDKPARFLKNLVSQHNIGGWLVQVCLPPADFQLLPTQHRNTANRDELIEAVRWNLREDFDEPAAGLALDVFDGPTTAAGVRTLYAASAGKLRVEALMDTCRHAGLKPVGCGIAPIALGSVMKPLLGEHSAIIYLLLDQTVGLVTIYRDAEYQFSRRLPETPEWYLLRIADPATRDDGLLQLAVGMQRAIDEYQNHIAELPDDVVLCLAPDFPAMDATRTYINESLSHEAVTLNIDTICNIRSSKGASLSSHALMALGSALAID